ncbi:hypothetical protein [Streptomyces anulatus]|uniref:hypothetical protein n=1 Tax=Streptomyces anulatus TaxID=1892 RepID=UPI0036D8F68B
MKETVAALGRVHARLGTLKESPWTTSGQGKESPDKGSPWFGPEEETPSQNS